MRWRIRRGVASETRKGMRVVILEGLPSAVLFNCLAGPFLTSYLLFLGASSLVIGIAVAIPSLANITQVFMAFMMHRVRDRKKVMVVLVAAHRLLWVLSGLLPFFLPQSWGIPMYLAALLAAFLFNAFASVVWGSMMGDLVPGKVRGKYFGIRNTLTFAASSLTLLLGGYVLEVQPGTTGFAVLFLICLAAAFTNIALYKNYPNPPFDRPRREDVRSLLHKPFGNRPFLMAMMFISLWMFLQNMAVPFFSYVMQDLLKVSIQTVSMITAAQNIAMLVGFYTWGIVNTKLPTRKVLLMTLPFIMLACLLWSSIYAAPTVPMLFLIHALLGFGMSGLNQMMFIFTIGDTPKEDRPIYFSVFNAVVGIFTFVGPIAGGIVYDMLVGRPAWVQEVGVSTVIGIGMLLAISLLGPIAFKTPPKRRA